MTVQPRFPGPNALTQLVSGLVSCPGPGCWHGPLGRLRHLSPASVLLSSPCCDLSVRELKRIIVRPAVSQPGERRNFSACDVLPTGGLGEFSSKIRDYFHLPEGKWKKGQSWEFLESYIYLNDGNNFLIFHFLFVF